MLVTKDDGIASLVFGAACIVGIPMSYYILNNNRLGAFVLFLTHLFAFVNGINVGNKTVEVQLSSTFKECI